MNLAELSINRPVLATVMSILIVIFGAVGYTFLGVREFPAIDPPVVTVRTVYTGANADIIESQITEPLEKAINGVQGIRTISSSSSFGASQITVEFDLGEDLANAANDVRDKVNQAQRNLPQDLDAPPVVQKADANDFIIILAIRSSKLGLLQLSDYAENVLAERLQTIKGVSVVNLFGQKRYAMRLWLQPEKMAAYGITPNDVARILQRENVELPSGKLYGENTELSFRPKGRLVSEEDFANLIVRQTAQGIVRLSSIARVELGAEDIERIYRLNGTFGVALAIVPQPGANHLEIADEFYKRLEKIKNDKKESDIDFTIAIDTTKNVRRSIVEVQETLLIAFSLVVLVILFFFRSFLIAFRPLIDIPISLIGAFFVMYLAGFSINVLTLLGIVLATGLVVDDGIVVTENIFRKIEEGLPIRKAAIDGSKEIFFAVIATSLTLAVVFMPVIFLQGFVGRLFREFGVVLAGSVLISAFVSLTITPVLNVKLNRGAHNHGRFYERTEPFFEAMERIYRRTLEWFLRRKWVSWIILVLSIGTIVLVGSRIPTELAPTEDRSNIRFTLTGPEGTSFEAMNRYTTRLATFLRDSFPEITTSFEILPGFTATGVNTAFTRVIFTDPKYRTRSQKQLLADINKKLPLFNDTRVFGIEEQTISVGLSSRGALPVQFVLQNLDFEKLKKDVPRFLAEVRKDPTFLNSDVNLKFSKPELELRIDRIRARDLGVTVADISELLQLANSGRRVSYFDMNGRQYQVIAQLDRPFREQPSDLDELFVRNERGQLIRLSSVISLVEASSPPALFHYNRFKSATISASLAEGKTIGDGVKAMRKIAASMLDESYQTSLTGPARDFEESSSNVAFAFVLALVLIYLVLAAQFESFRDPLVIMITVPLALCGALLSLGMAGQTLNIFSQIGMIMLIGLVTKNGILIVEFANQRRDLGSSKFDAVLDASVLRLRPILMTSLATALGALPIALSLGAAATSRIPLGVVIVGGILFSLVLTLVVIPSLYLNISPGKRRHGGDEHESVEGAHV